MKFFAIDGRTTIMIKTQKGAFYDLGRQVTDMGASRTSSESLLGRAA